MKQTEFELRGVPDLTRINRDWIVLLKERGKKPKAISAYALDAFLDRQQLLRLCTALNRCMTTVHRRWNRNDITIEFKLR